VQLEAGRSATADETYIRESILNPQAKVVAGFQPIMPTFKGLISEDGITQIIAYLKSLKREERAQGKK
jgi:cytochrome c oxidase subunit 2